MKNCTLILSLYCVLGLASSCIKDTCNTSFGNTFEEVTLDSTSVDSLMNLTLEFALVSNAELPSAYYNAVIPNDSATATLTQIESTSTSLKWKMSENSLPEVGETLPFEFNFEYEDRQEYTACQHPGSKDRYILSLKFNLNQSGEGIYEVSNFTWSEYFIAGYL